MNVELLRKIAVVIQEKPAEFDMRGFTRHTERGTTHCIGGWARQLTGNYNMAQALGLTEQQADRLFYVESADTEGWPKQFRGVEDGGDWEHAWRPTIAQTVARIEHFIATDGHE